MPGASSFFRKKFHLSCKNKIFYFFIFVISTKTSVEISIHFIYLPENSHDFSLFLSFIPKFLFT